MEEGDQKISNWMFQPRYQAAMEVLDHVQNFQTKLAENQVNCSWSLHADQNLEKKWQRTDRAVDFLKRLSGVENL